jgi:hypothetical protein
MKNADAAIAELGAKLDSWFDRNRAIFSSHDRDAQSKALVAGIEIVQELDSLKQQGLRAIRALLRRRNATTPQEHVAALLCGFELATKLGDALHDELLDTDGESKLIGLKNEIADVLDATDRGRGVLAALLNHPDAGVRASAGAYLLIANVMPKRAVAVLSEIENNNESSNRAYFKAHRALLDWNLKQKAAGKKP